MKASEIKLNPDNPRLIKDEKYKKLVQSLKDFPEMADVREVVVNKDHTILGGNMRFKAMQEAGWTDIPVKVVDWSEDKQKEFIIKDNASFGEWDWDIIADQYELADLDAWGIDLPKGLLDTEVEEDEAPEVSEIVEPRSKLGEVYSLGRHRLMCGDATDFGAVSDLMDGKQADMVFTDPPYNTQIQQGRTSSEWGIIKNDDMTPEKFTVFIKEVLQNLYTFCEGSKYVCIDWRGFATVYSAMPNVSTTIVWVKNQFGLGSGYRPQHEFILFDGKLAANDQSNVWDFRKDSANSYDHPTQKPTGLVSIAIKNSSKREDKVLDLFGGSGSTLIACEKADRTCYMMELDCRYIDVIIRRFIKFTNGEQPVNRLSDRKDVRNDYTVHATQREMSEVNG